MSSRLAALVLAASLTPISRGQDITLQIHPGEPAPRAALRPPRLPGTAPAPARRYITLTQGDVTVSIYVDDGPAVTPPPTPPDPPSPPAPNPPDPNPPAPTGQGATDADFAGASRMYLRGIPLGLRQVAGKVGKDVKTMDELRDEIEAARKRAGNGLARRLATRWAGSIDSSGNITNPQPIIDSLNEAAAAMEAGLR